MNNAWSKIKLERNENFIFVIVVCLSIMSAVMSEKSKNSLCTKNVRITHPKYNGERLLPYLVGPARAQDQGDVDGFRQAPRSKLQLTLVSSFAPVDSG